MSSLIIDANGLRRIEVFVRGKRKRIHLGRLLKVRVRIDSLARRVVENIIYRMPSLAGGAK